MGIKATTHPKRRRVANGGSRLRIDFGSLRGVLRIPLSNSEGLGVWKLGDVDVDLDRVGHRSLALGKVDALELRAFRFGGLELALLPFAMFRAEFFSRVM